MTSGSRLPKSGGEQEHPEGNLQGRRPEQRFPQLGH